MSSSGLTAGWVDGSRGPCCEQRAHGALPHRYHVRGLFVRAVKGLDVFLHVDHIAGTVVTQQLATLISASFTGSLIRSTFKA